MPAFKKVKTGTRVTRCTPDVVSAMCNYLRLGAYPETAAVMAGISKETFLDWMKKAHPHHKGYKKVYADCLHAVSKAVEEATVRDLMNIDKCAMGAEVEYMRDEKGGIVFSQNGRPIVLKPGSQRDWSASAWRLERRSRDWNKTERKELSGPDGKPIETKNSVDEESAKLAAKSLLETMKEILE